MTQVIEVYEGHDVTTAAISVNIGSGLLEAMKVDPHLYLGGEIIDAVVRFRIKRVSHEPVIKDDYEGPWKRIHVGIPLAAVPVENPAVQRLLDAHIAKVSKHRELPGQQSIDDQIGADAESNVRGIKTAKKAAKKAPAKKRVPAAPKTTPTGSTDPELS